MFILYAFLISLGFICLDLIFIKIFQLENYRLKNYIKKVYIFKNWKSDKNKLVFTKRIKRLIFIDFLSKFLIFSLIFAFINICWILFLIIILSIIYSPIFILLSFLITLPVEEGIKLFYLKKAKRKLQKMSCKKIAITGSFGKTSTKNILYQILKEEFDVCATPKSYNTPMGVCRTILEDLKETDDFFVVEMGARHKGDIEFLAKYIGVDFGIITPIGNCHLETFGSLENIESTKYELCSQVRNYVIFNGQSKSTKKLYEKYSQNKFLVCQDNSFAYARNIKTTSNGAEFELCLKDKVMPCRTKLLGKSNIDNIVVASAMAFLLGESLFNIQKGIEKLQPVAHRLELIKSELVNVIDDSYNSNFGGFIQALEVLSGFNGKKIVVSPGIVELGKAQEEINFKVGEKVAEVADVFVIMNETNKKSLFEGAIKGGLNEKNIYFALSRQEQTQLLKNLIMKGDVVLFENDLPDNFA